MTIQEIISKWRCHKDNLNTLKDKELDMYMCCVAPKVEKELSEYLAIILHVDSKTAKSVLQYVDK